MKVTKRRGRYRPFKSGGGCSGTKIEEAGRDTIGRVAATNRQLEIVAAIRELTNARGFAPTVRELQAHFGYSSPHGVVCHLRLLRRKGWVTWIDRLNRTLKVVGE